MPSDGYERFPSDPEHLRRPTDGRIQVVANASSIQADLTKAFIVGGTSAGANFAISISHLARDEGLSPSLTGVWLSVPVVMSPPVVPEKYRAQYLSYEQNRDSPVLSRAEIDMLIGESFERPIGVGSQLIRMPQIRCLSG